MHLRLSSEARVLKFRLHMSVTCLAADTGLTADPGVVSLILA